MTFCSTDMRLKLPATLALMWDWANVISGLVGALVGGSLTVGVTLLTGREAPPVRP
jgi:hypothetical protein